MRIVAAGVSGFLGTSLVGQLTAAGHQVTRLVRSAPSGPHEMQWNPHSGDIDSSVFDGADAVINLCGAGVDDHRWTQDYKHLIVTSRVNPTRLLAAECARLGVPVLINASGSRVLRAARHGDRDREGSRRRYVPGRCVCAMGGRHRRWPGTPTSAW